MTNSQTKNICYNKQFWLDKAYLYQIPTTVLNLPKTPSQWIKLFEINDQVDILLQVIQREFEFENNIVIDVVGDKIDYTLLPFLKLDFNLPALVIRKNKHQDIILSTEPYIDGEYVLYSKITNWDEIKEIVIILMYYYPNLRVHDGFGYSFFLKPLIGQIALFEDQDLKQYKDLVDRYNFINKLNK